MTNKYTAILRKKLSLPMKILREFVEGDCLDYGCGRGFDCSFLGIDGYDPNWKPDIPKKKYDRIFCNYVLNVVSVEEEAEIIEHVKSLLKPKGLAFFTVRRDIDRDYSVRDYCQRVVKLDMESFYLANGKFEIYLWRID